MKRILRWVVVGFGILVLFVCTVTLTIYLGTRPFVYSSPIGSPSAEVAIVPGAPLTLAGTPAPIFLDRMDGAIALYEAGKVSKILVSGDNRTPVHNEVGPARDYLLVKGIPDKDILLDHAGFDTYSTAYRARVVFGVSSAIITTQSFHLPRALFIARSLGITAYGLSTDVGHVLYRNYARELFADQKALFDLAVGREPEYLGTSTPFGDTSKEK